MFGAYLNEHDLKSMLLPREGYRPFPRRQERDIWNSLSEEKRGALLAWGEEAKAGYPMLTATQFLAFSRNGSRMAYEEPYFERRRKLIGAVLAECVQDDGGYLDAVIDGLWCICEESTWVISAHNGSDHPGAAPMNKRPLPDTENPYVDLFSAQTCAALADTLYLLEDKLDGVSPLLARRVRREIERRVLHPFMTHDDFWWMGMIRRDVNNWTPWILSNVIDTALLLERDETRRAEIVARAMRMLDSYLAIMPADGGCDEGAGYFNMAGASLLDCLESVYLATEGRVSFYHEPHIRAIGEFPLRAHLTGAYFLNFADCDAMPRMDGERIWRYGMRTENAALAALGAWLHAQDMRCNPPARPVDTPQMHRTLLRLFAQIPEGTREPEHAAFEAFPDLQVFVWRRGGLIAAMKGGHNGESHNHNDVGSFVVYDGGRPQIIDMGNKIYTAVTFGPDRYTLDNTRARNHNIPLLGGAEQCAGQAYAARDVQADETGARMEIAGAYPDAAGAQSFVRALRMEDGAVRLTDEIALAEDRDVVWVFMLRDRPELEAGCAHLGTLDLWFDADLSAACEEMPVTDARMARNFPGSIWRLTLTAKPDRRHSRIFTIARR
ncbi:MAG: heparinase II/III family protein [Clostridia bacterium]|nr:heparinase II/III family protein [Clostridia bacterium]